MSAGRSIWNGALGWGMVIIPIKLYSATETHDVQFRQVHREDGGRIQYRRVCSIDGEEVPYSDVAKGYELPDGQVITLTDEDMANLPLPSVKRVEVLQFINPAKVDALLLDKPYYALPDGPAAVHAYALLTAVMRQRSLVAVVKIALRQRESLALLSERDGTLVLTLLRWSDEVRETPRPDPVPLDEAQVKMAATLVDAMIGDFSPGDYSDDYTAAISAMVSDKIAGVVATGPSQPATGAPIGLNEALAASVAAAKEAKAGTSKNTRKDKKSKLSKNSPSA